MVIQLHLAAGIDGDERNAPWSCDLIATLLQAYDTSVLDEQVHAQLAPSFQRHHAALDHERAKLIESNRVRRVTIIPDNARNLEGARTSLDEIHVLRDNRQAYQSALQIEGAGADV